MVGQIQVSLKMLMKATQFGGLAFQFLERTDMNEPD
jgi:hypothetical protein